jgi:hypothetical protein
LAPELAPARFGADGFETDSGVILYIDQ